MLEFCNKLGPAGGKGLAIAVRKGEQLSATERLLIEFLNNANVGLGIVDARLRYRALNLCLAEMNGTAIETHLGKTLREILGEVALQVEPAIKQVLATGKPIYNFALTGIVPARAETTRFVDHLFPLKDARGRVTRVGAVVVELPPDKKPERTVGVIHEALSEIAGGNEILRSWKGIAKYIGACVKTVQRWEQHYSFPIRRLERRRGAVVFALKAEVDSWIRLRASIRS